MVDQYNVVVENKYSTVVAKYPPDGVSEKPSPNHQSETALEYAFIEQLKQQAYERLDVKDDRSLKINLRKQLENLNNYSFSEREWDQFFKSELANPNQSISEKTTTIQKDHIKNLHLDNGAVKNIYLLDKKNIHNNHLQVINQYTSDQGKRLNRYDVTILVNGLPLVHIELKRRGVAIKEAFNQIRRYARESFFADSGLFEYVQLFVITNGTDTKYYSNSTRDKHLKEHLKKTKPGKKTSNSFEFTSWWADATNRPIPDLMDFSKTFFAKHTLLNVLIHYCVFTVDNELLVMRPYQIVATERILNRIEVSSNYNHQGRTEAGGYIWHTTGSGKTLTSFKAAQMASKFEAVKKVLFVVDRKDLDYQTMKEYDNFEKGSANSNTSTKVLRQQLENPNARIIITTIQKLDRFIRTNKEHEIFKAHLVLIFDECHRSQFGEMHRAITKKFKKYHLFGFTGTPIFAKNATSKNQTYLKTTEQAFGKNLHTYTIVDAIADKNVLPFKVDYISTMKEAENIEDKKVNAIDRESALASKERIDNIVAYIIEHFDQKTKRNSHYEIRDRRLAGFNSIFTVASIPIAMNYYQAFKDQLKNQPCDKNLKIAIIFSFSANEEEADGFIDENSEDTSQLDDSSRDFLDRAIEDYNQLFGTSYNTSADKFQNYYKDVSNKVKNREIDVLIVVNMFLTGFDATTLNTLWVDKNLQLHGLLQAFSRTNRILNTIKKFGNIICFRNLEEATNRSIALFGDKEACGIVLLKTYNEYYHGYEEQGKVVAGYKYLIETLLEQFPLEQLIVGERAQKTFIKLYGKILRIKNVLTSFDEFEEQKILSDREVQDYHSRYIDLYEELRNPDVDDKENINDDLIFEMELVKQIEINIDYILDLIKKYHHEHLADKEILVDIDKAIGSSIELRNKKKLINQFINSLDPMTNFEESWHNFVKISKKNELDLIIKEESLKIKETYQFVDDAFRNGFIQTTGTEIPELLPKTSFFSEDNNRAKKRGTVLAKLQKYFNRYYDISSE